MSKRGAVAFGGTATRSLDVGPIRESTRSLVAPDERNAPLKTTSATNGAVELVYWSSAAAYSRERD